MNRKTLNYKRDIIDEYNIKSVLLLRQDRLGDLIISETFIRLLREKHPEIQLDIILGKRNRSANFIVSDYIDSYCVYNQKIISDISLIMKLRSRKYDLIIDLQDKPSRTSKLLIDLIAPKYSAGFNFEELSNRYYFLVDRWDRAKYHITERASKLLELFAYDVNNINFDYQIKLKRTFDLPIIDKIHADGKKVFIINLSGNSKERYWGEENYIKFIKLIRQKSNDYQFLLTYTKEYSQDAENISKATGAINNGLIDSFEKYIYTLSKADIILTPDTSAVHIASAFKIKQIALYNFNLNSKDNDEMPWLPYNSPAKVFGSESCIMSDISPVEVVDNIKNFI